ncbi:hypothetical protein MPK66_gp254 [Erwinia phage pEa_SNUABM_2]|uniref:Uncharacterized protein n=1 Tax=Erwinia phage pEa_SNUABM_2 TaxID=2869547 RepID=A0AAE7XT80_9CAUD|nr:hypothetical protein MPK66_gp254 [Erwinia phage pEa_SNUABM_2]QZE59498.1 hypothetical protein pEaSNUABM2_00254 [Erwinia phage pEa_SNUABM_2]QZE59834.1 hypothetical protein pEaSNUABM39_00254 [Erwinia phage pEa_SNUABM_39]
MKNQYLILRMPATNFYDKQFLMRGFNAARIEQVIGVIVIIGDEHSHSLKNSMYRLAKIHVEQLTSDTQQNLVKLRWSSVDSKLIEEGMTRIPTELTDAIRAMRNNRLYYEVDTTIPQAFRECHTEFDMPTGSQMRERINKRLRDSQKKDVLDKFTVEELLQHLKKRTGAEITIKL